MCRSSEIWTKVAIFQTIVSNGKSKAIDYYRKFLVLWKDAEFGIAEVEDAKKRLVGVKSK